MLAGYSYNWSLVNAGTGLAHSNPYELLVTTTNEFLFHPHFLKRVVFQEKAAILELAHKRGPFGLL